MDSNLIDFIGKKEEALVHEAYAQALEDLDELTTELLYEISPLAKQEVFQKLAEIQAAWATAFQAAQDM